MTHTKQQKPKYRTIIAPLSHEPTAEDVVHRMLVDFDTHNHYVPQEDVELFCYQAEGLNREELIELCRKWVDVI